MIEICSPPALSFPHPHGARMPSVSFSLSSIKFPSISCFSCLSVFAGQAAIRFYFIIFPPPLPEKNAPEGIFPSDASHSVSLFVQFLLPFFCSQPLRMLRRVVVPEALEGFCEELFFLLLIPQKPVSPGQIPGRFRTGDLAEVLFLCQLIGLRKTL